ncbi:MAG TPA: hypothetical protein VKA26_13705 [Ignavibacteriaceae bacterium]|nr:hypothetical protein [Ignavibacteriaceae bacterium]
MKDQKTKDKFIELRAEGLSYNKISKKIRTSKPILVKWNDDFNDQIKKLKNERFIETLEKYKVTREQRISRLSNALDKAWNEFDRKNFKDLSKKELLQMITQINKQLSEETDKLKTDKEFLKEIGPMRIEIVRRRIGPGYDDKKEED